MVILAAEMLGFAMHRLPELYRGFRLLVGKVDGFDWPRANCQLFGRAHEVGVGALRIKLLEAERAQWTAGVQHG